jgi:amino acid adenylation domain-containing protein
MSKIPTDFTFEAIDFDPFAQSATSVTSTEAQREIFTSVQLGGDAANCAYNESVTLKISGPLNKELLKDSFSKVIERHDAFRSTFSEDGSLLFISSSINLPWIETTVHSEEEKFQLLKRVTKEATLQAFDLRNGPLVRVQLISYKDKDFHLIVTGHHIICDGWSLSLMLRELSIIYSATKKGESVELEPAVSFIQYAKELEQENNSIQQQQVESFWMQQFKDDVPVVEFPNDNSRPSLRTFHAKRIDAVVPEEVVKGMRSVSKKTNASFVTLMLSAFESFLFHVTSQENLIVGLPAAGQNVAGRFNLVGHCVNLLPLKTKIQPEQPFSEYLKSRKGYLFDAYDHQQFTFGSLIQKLNIQRDPSRIPLVPIVFNVDIGFTDGFVFDGCTFEASTNPRFFENFEIFLNASGSGNQLTLECTFNNDLFNEEIMQIRMQEFICIMESIIENPEQPVGKLNCITALENRIFEKNNDTKITHEKPIGIHECIEETSSTLKKNHIAIVGGDRHITYEELNYLSGHWAARLQVGGIKEGDFIGVCLRRTAELPVVLLSILKSGAAYIPLDPDFPTDRLHYMVEDAPAKYVIISKDLQSELQFPEDKVILFEDLKNESNGIEYTKNIVKPDTLAYVLYTSGSTGKPKGVAVRHISVTNLLNDLAPKMGLDREERLLSITTISFDISVLEFFMPLMHGAGLHLANKMQAMDPRWMSNYIDQKSIRFMQATPATYDLLFTGGWEGKKDLAVLCGGEALRIELAHKLLSCNRDVWNLYGPTETTIWSTTSLITEQSLNRQRNGILSIGRPIANTKIYIMNQHGQPCPIGVSGELWIGGEGVSEGYLNRPELTQEKFIPSPDGEGMVYKTGDRVIMDLSGHLYFLNRFDHQVKVRGYRIELGEIETALNNCKEIQQSVVLTHPDSSGQNMLVTWFKPTSTEFSDEDIISRCKNSIVKQLPDYMVPAVWISMKEFPLTPNGKIDRKALPQPGQTKIERNFLEEETTTPLQKSIINLWEEVLQIPNIRLDDDFFQLGGHSILAVKIMVELEKLTSKKLPLAVLFTSPTIRELSALYEQHEDEKVWNPIVPLREGGINKALFFAHGISGNVFKYHGLGQRLTGSQPSYGLQAYGLNGKDTPFHDMKSMAAYHIKAIRAVQPEGPYYLAGGSFGGYLAYEMAVQLKEAGQDIGFLCLFDIDAAKKKEFLPTGMKQIVDVQLLAERFMKRAVELAKADKEERKSYFEARKKQQERNNDIESWLEKYKVTEMIGAESAAYFRRVEEACHDALMSYKIREYDGDILLVRAKDNFFNNEYDTDLGWSHYVKGKVEVLFAPGDHNSIFWPPNVEFLAEKIGDELEKKMR